ncbi:3-hydroxyacyl-CoA dehydrogenase NAD-binding domain-containing protein [Terasakiella pusilla]|uniref:3-hydroxyacyl-CoA dehydrogenase NAD-binding domain-containing protein n=1 Tax=Terasakiella pusilla TaxID=64973 RepID=UPI00048C4A90|nr:3-hydroxyacyl-CoA dehydrogenase NAD-binding domain-containing protein [Terasakiella pusilla]
MSAVTYELLEDIGIITVNNPPVNALSHAVRDGLQKAVQTAQTDDSKAILILCEGKTFIAGADISEFGQPPKAPLLPDVMTTIEQSQKPVVAALHGTALGGGFEIALSCHYRCAVPSAKVGLPEIKLGLLPGAGGTQRAPRLAGVKNALDLMISGNPIGANTAKDYGLIDHVLDAADLKQSALSYVKELLANGKGPRMTSALTVETSDLEDTFFDDYKKSIAKKTKNQIAHNHIVDCIEASIKLPFEDGMKKERACFLECRTSSQSKALRHIFFAERQARKVEAIPKETPIRDIQRVGVIGGGLMGCGIAMNFANAGIPVTLLEINQDALDKGLKGLEKIYQGAVKKGKSTQEAADKCLSLITGTTHYDDFSDVDLVIEAVFESMDVKKQVFGKLDEVCKDGAILASNTSYLDINEIAQATKRPQDVIGLHFFSPAHIMKLLEIVQADKTADDVVATSMKMAAQIKKNPVLAKVCYGFIGNRMLRQYLREVQICLLEGALPQQIDKAMMDWGMAMGPLMVADMAGLDISYKARQELTLEQKGDPRSYRIADVLVEAGRLGQKTNAGYYAYDPETRQRTEDPAVVEIIERVAADLNVKRAPLSDDEIRTRLLLTLINEGYKILEEGIAQRASDIDVVYCFGYGFPSYRGGPMFQAEEMGLDKVLDQINAYKETLGAQYWTASSLLEDLAAKAKEQGAA